MDKKDIKLISIFTLIAVVFGIGSFFVFYLFEVGIFDLSYKAISLVAFIYTLLLLYYFSKLKAQFPYSHAVLSALMLNFVFSVVMATTVFIMLTVFDQEFLNRSIHSAVSTVIKSKEGYLDTISLNEFNSRIEIIKSTTAKTISTDFFIKFSGIGILYTLILSLIFRKK